LPAGLAISAIILSNSLSATVPVDPANVNR
jgi:hypothetical protein